MWNAFGIAFAVYAVVMTHSFAAEIATDWMYGWHRGLEEKLRPVKTAYRAHLRRQSENGPMQQEAGNHD